jgi:hypothetical protein
MQTSVARGSCVLRIRIVFSTILLGALLPGSPAAGAARFIPAPPVIGSGGVPQQVLTADVNKDGFADLIASNDNGKVTVLLGKGNGTFAPPVTIATISGGAPPTALGDFNSDGVPDLAILSKSANMVWIYIGHGDGTFAAPTKTSTPASPAQIAVGDVNGDGRADVVTISPSGLSAYLGDGHGGLQTAITTATSMVGNTLALGDVNTDGRLDVMVETTTFLGRGDGHFTQINNPVDLVGPYSPAQQVLADLDADGNLDLVVAALSFARGVLGSVVICWGNGDGTFQGGMPLTAGTDEASVVVVDINRDGKADLAAASSTNSTGILLNQGGRRFAPAVSYRTNNRLTGNLPVLRLTSADFNGDGQPDLAIATQNGIQLVRNVGGGKFFAQTAIELGGTGGDLFALRLNGDAHQDLTVESYIGPNGLGNLLVLYGDGVGQFPQRFTSFADAYPDFSGLAVGDLNRDGRQDLAYGVADVGVSTLLNSGNAFVNGPSSGILPAFGMVAGDFNNDGFSDLVVNDGPNSNVILYLNNGDDTFRAATSYATGGFSVSIRAMDINKDGKRDLILTDDHTNAITVLLGNGNGTFQPARLSPVSKTPIGFTVGDFNRDGKLDVAVAQDQLIDILLGRGDGTFAQETSYPTAGPVYSLIQTDLRHDNKQDLLFVDSQLLWLQYGNGDGTFQPPVSFNVGPNPIALTVGDFNEDGAPDVAVSDAQSYSLALLLNLGGTRISLKSSASSVRVGQPITFTATVAASVPGVPVPTGTVAIKDGAKGIGFVHLSNGKVTFTTSSLGVGTHTMTASYWETSSFSPHVSSPITIQITP